MSDTGASSSPSSGDVSGNLVQINREIPSRNVVATGFGIAVGIGIMGLIGRFVFSYDSKTAFLGYLLLILFVTPFLLTYSERVEALTSRGGLYGLVRRRYGLTFSYLVGWLELAGYATVIAILAKIIATYGATMYEVLVGDVSLSLTWLALGVLIVVVLLEVAGVRGSRKLNTTLAFAGLVFMVVISIVSLLHMPDRLTNLPTSLKTIAPFKLSTLLTSTFWGVVLIFGMRHRIIRGAKKPVARASWTIMLIVIFLGMLISFATIPFGDKPTISGVLTANHRSALVYTGDPIYTVLIAIFSLLISIVGLTRALRASSVVMTQMTEDGYFPESFNYRVNKAIFPPMLFVGVLAFIIIFFVESPTNVGMAAAFLLAATFLIHVPDLTRSSPQLPSNRPIHLPYHPLFPALTVVTATLAFVNLPPDSLKWSGVWFLAGVLLLAVYSYNRAIKTRAKTSIISEEEQVMPGVAGKEAPLPSGPLVMAVIRDDDTLPVILRLGSRVAERVQGTLIIMQIIQAEEGLTEEEQQQRGAQLWRKLSLRLKEISIPQKDVVVRPMVRVANDVILGVINAAEEVRPQYMFVAPDFVDPDPDQNLQDYDQILMKSSSHVVFLNRLPKSDDFKHIAVFIDRGIQAPISLNLARILLAEDGVLELVHVITPAETESHEEERRTHILNILQELDIPESNAKITIVHADSVEDAVEQISKRVDLTVIGANKNFMTRLPSFTGINAQLFQHVNTPLILVAKHERIRFAWLSKLWIFLTNPLPKLTLEDREEAARNIISGADATIDFFILILLSAGIATYGLLQNSGAVIIGAMLVAPLMSPIVAVAMSMIRGDVKHLGLAVQSTAQGVLLAISVGAVLTFFSPIKAPTNEIMGRVNPNLLDLSIAFLSGAAGAYAMSRKSIASALPGVSIAVALVPPLAVVGYGFATADLDIAFGALLLFFTNFIAIVLAASLVFIALDFLTTEKQTWGEIVRGLRVTMVFAVIVLLILGWVTYSTVRDQSRLNAINQVLNQKLYAASFKPLDVQVEHTRNGYVIKGIVLSFMHPLSADDLAQLGKDLEAAAGGKVTLDITSVPAKGEQLTFDTAIASAEIEETIRAKIQELPVEELLLTVEPSPNRYEVTLAVMEFKPNALSPELISDLETSLTEKYGKPVEINVYAIPTQKVQPLEKPPTPTPGP